MVRLVHLLALCAFVALSIATSPSFCKCTCFTNSTIIALSDAHSKSDSSTSKSGSKSGTKGGSKGDSKTDSVLESRAQSATCALCNRAFCLSYNLPICKGAEEKDVFTQCFQRDSAKDQAIVILFIGTTLGLLGWAGLQKFLEKRQDKSGIVQGQYARVGSR